MTAATCTSRRPAADEDRGRQRLDRLGARILRLLHLRDRGLARLPADFLPVEQPDRRHRRLARDLRRRICRAADRRLRARPFGRHPWPQERAAPLPRPHGPLDHGGRAAAHLSASRDLGADSARGPAPDPGLCGRGRNFGRELDDPRTRAVRTARLFRELHPAGRAGGPDPGGRGLSTAELRALERCLHRLGLARAVPAERARADRRLYHPARGRRDARVHRRAGARRRAEDPGRRRIDQPLAATCCGSSAWR